MKKHLPIILLISAISLLLCSCNTPGNSNVFDDDDPTVPTTESTLPYYTVARSPHHDLSRVDTTENFGTVDLSYRDPWGAYQNLRMAHGTIHNYFSYYTLDGSDRRVNENLSDTSAISRPTVLEYPADEDGYVIYEVTYTQMFPIGSKEPAYGSYYTSFFSYHGVGYLDYYTGQIFPVINMSSQIDSFSVTGQVIWEGKTYDMSYYEFRETEWLESNTEEIDSNTIVRRELVKITSTSYFIVPKGYDGIVMFVYVADDTGTPIEQVLAENNPYFTGAEQFGDDENPDDYVFIGIQAPE